MFIISGGKGIGKTRTLLEKAKFDNAIIVCEDAVKMRNRAHGYGITGLEIISYGELYEQKVYNQPVYIHDINKFVKYNFPEVKGYSVCNE